MAKLYDRGKLDELTKALASHIEKQRDEWIRAFYKVLYDDKKIRENYKLSVEAALPIVSAFQTIHVISFIGLFNYIKKEQIEEFTGIFLKSLYEVPPENFIPYMQRYQSNREKDFKEQIRWFCEDVANATTGSFAGMTYGEGFYSMAMEFLFINWAIAAKLFGDKSTHEVCRRDLAEIRNLKSIRPPNGWFEKIEKFYSEHNIK